MAVMSTAQRDELMADIMRAVSGERASCAGIETKALLRSVLNAIDQWCSDNQASFNSAIPAGPRAAMAADMKSRFLEAVVARRRREGVT